MTQEETIEFIKCAKNPIYFLNNYGYIFDITKSTIDKLTLYDIQKEVLENYVSNKNNIILKSRQTGISVITSGYVCWKMLFNENERILIVANDGAGARRFLGSVKQFLDYLPAFLRPDVVPTNNTQQIIFSNGSWCKAVASGGNAGRGETLTMLILDETAFIDNAEEIWMAAGLALSAESAKCIMVSTPNGSSGLYHATWTETIKKQKTDKNAFVGTEVHWNRPPYYAKDLEQRTDEHGKKFWWSPWYEKQCELLKWDKVKIAQELDLSFEGSAAVVIESWIIDKYDSHCADIKPVCYYDYKEPSERFVSRETKFYVWEKPQPKRNYIIGCLPTGEKVLTNSGLKNIEDIDFNDLLVDKNGEYVNIKNIQITSDIEDCVYEIKPSNVYRKTKFTANHPILSSNKVKLKRNYKLNHEIYRFNERYWDVPLEFLEAKDIKIGDWLIYPNIYKNNILESSEIKEKWNKYENSTRKDFIIKNPLLDEEFWWFIGMWLAEGWTIKNKNSYNICTSHNNKTEQYFVKKIKNIFSKYNKSVCTTIKEIENSISTQFTSKQIFEFINENFGKGAKNKILPEWVKFLPENYKLELIKGYLEGDGCWFKEGLRGDSRISFVSISLELLEGIQDILFSIGLISSLQLLRNESKAYFKRDGKIRECNTQKTYQLNLCHFDSVKLADKLKYSHEFILKNNRIIKDCFFSKDLENIYFKIKDVNKILYKGNVYNFETENHTFLCKNITTHNCDISRGDGEDFSTVEVIDADTLNQVAEYQGKIPPDIFAELIYKVATDYNMAFVAAECNNHGLATTLALKNVLKYPTEKIHHSKSIKKIYVRHGGVDYVDQDSEIPGFQTTTKTRPLLMSCLAKYMRETQVKINSKRLLSEFRTFINKGDKPEHADGYHDDLIFAFAIALFMRDTEFDNVFKSKEFFKAMLDSISFQSNSRGIPTNTQKEDGQRNIQTPDSDLSWLYGPISKG